VSAVPLASATDLEARLGRGLTDPEGLRVGALLTDASAKVRRYCRQTFDTVTNDVVVLRSQDGEIRLPQRPVLNVSKVVALGGNGLPPVQLLDWLWDGLDLIRLGSGNVVINLPEVWWDEDGYPDTYQITYSHGPGEVPPEVVSVVCAMVNRTITNPTMAGGIKSETVGHYNYQLDAAGGGLSVTMTAADQAELKDYRRPFGEIRVRPGV